MECKCVLVLRGEAQAVLPEHVEKVLARLREFTEVVDVTDARTGEPIGRGDADMAVEVSALTRAQILVQSTQSTLQIANSIPQMVLTLLE